jgi:hypothetical protein
MFPQYPDFLQRYIAKKQNEKDLDQIDPEDSQNGGDSILDGDDAEGDEKQTIYVE